LDSHLTEACLESGATQDFSQLVPLEDGLFRGLAEACQIWNEAQC